MAYHKPSRARSASPSGRGTAWYFRNLSRWQGYRLATAEDNSGFRHPETQHRLRESLSGPLELDSSSRHLPVFAQTSHLATQPRYDESAAPHATSDRSQYYDGQNNPTVYSSRHAKPTAPFRYYGHREPSPTIDQSPFQSWRPEAPRAPNTDASAPAYSAFHSVGDYEHLPADQVDPNRDQRAIVDFSRAHSTEGGMRVSTETQALPRELSGDYGAYDYQQQRSRGPISSDYQRRAPPIASHPVRVAPVTHSHHSETHPPSLGEGLFEGAVAVTGPTVGTPRWQPRTARGVPETHYYPGHGRAAYS